VRSVAGNVWRPRLVNVAQVHRNSGKKKSDWVRG
jgi:hypothetical protein